MMRNLYFKFFPYRIIYFAVHCVIFFLFFFVWYCSHLLLPSWLYIIIKTSVVIVVPPCYMNYGIEFKRTIKVNTQAGTSRLYFSVRRIYCYI